MSDEYLIYTTPGLLALLPSLRESNITKPILLGPLDRANLYTTWPDGPNIHHHHHKHQGLDPLIRSVSRVTAARANASLVFQLFSFLVVCSGMISKGFGFVAFFARLKASFFCIHLYCLVCL